MNIAPDLLSPEVHEWPISYPVSARVKIEKAWFRDRIIAANHTPREMAKNFIKSEIARGFNDEQILEEDHVCGNAYWDFFFGPTCGKIPKGKMKVKMYDQNEEIFNIKELIQEVRLEKNQKSLF